MLAALRARKTFDLDLDERFYADVQKELAERDRLVVGLATLDGTPVAGNVTSIHGDTAVYLLGATTDQGLKAQASYLLHWRTIELMRERDVAWYDLGGIDPEANPGVCAFKQRTNGFDVTAAGPFERVPEGFRARLTERAERTYARVRSGR
jgi:lipid II:glycine glycyltransferase (peptidoglycan interpeptide bridge formation enzyme)